MRRCVGVHVTALSRQNPTQDRSTSCSPESLSVFHFARKALAWTVLPSLGGHSGAAVLIDSQRGVVAGAAMARTDSAVLVLAEDPVLFWTRLTSTNIVRPQVGNADLVKSFKLVLQVLFLKIYCYSHLSRALVVQGLV